jgi:cytoskeletal protein RodZ
MPVSRPTRRLLVRLLVSVAALLVPSAAFADCAHDIIDQAYKGKITKTYSQACYNAAIRIEPVDGSSYSDIDSIIKQAKHSAALAALAADSKATTTPTTSHDTPRTQVAQPRVTTTAPPATTTRATVPKATAAVGGGRVTPASHGSEPVAPTPTVATAPAAPSALLGAPSATPVLDRLAPAHADDVPVAVIVLGVLAVLLVLAGVAGAVVRRRGRRSTT